jgi:cyclic pyranopterin phosphate synthase
MRLPLFPLPSDRPAGFDSGPRSIRAVRVLRISVTDRCNFRCVYCMPEEGVRWLEKDDLLTFEEVVEVAQAAAEVHGIRRFKLTGGEPSVRRGLINLVSMLRQSVGVDDLSLTTNGMLLDEMAAPLKVAGLDRLTVSIDSLRSDRFRRITRTGELATVRRGLDRAHTAGFGGLKINCVTMRGVNDDEFADFARLTVRQPVTVRFIEYMPLGDAAVSGQCSTRPVDESETGPAGGCAAQDRGDDVFVPETEVRAAIESELGPLIPVDRESEPGVGPANVYRLESGDPLGRIGFISAMSAPFCSTCNRLRLTATGVLRSCLFEGGEVDLKPILRHGPRRPGDRQRLLAEAMTECVRLKPEVHSRHGNEQMSRIGG